MDQGHFSSIPDFFEIELESLMLRTSNLDVDLYIRLGNRFTKVFKRDDRPDPGRFESYIKKGVKSLFAPLDERPYFLSIGEAFLADLAKKTNLTLAEKIRATIELSEPTYEEIRREIKPDLTMMERAMLMVTSILQDMAKKEHAIQNLVQLCRTDMSLGFHGISTAVIAHLIAQNQKISDQEFLKTLTTAAIFHDVGMGLLPEDISNPIRSLSMPQAEKLKEHLSNAGEILQNELNLSPDGLKAVAQHHEFFDGTGYLGLKGPEISPMARIITVADCYSALTTPQGTAAPLTDKMSALKYLFDEKELFDPECLSSLADLVKQKIA